MFEYTRTVAVRYQDFDTVGVANNATFATLVEEGRRYYLEDHLGISLDDSRVVLAHLEFDFERPVTEPTSVEVAVRAEDVGSSSFTLAYEVTQHGERIATAQSTQVAVDDAGRPRDLPESWRDALA
ncbi:thioesterase family protein [Salarchaeum sp. JOR-1]|uniref:acyl-CoA thioesterase n=1 Tax=Salarchaeum sp. JOR-1 TaxID=2599399 RepID=UPI00119880C4|nr:thioesterase family protein [Salarchaeum sp. JOR-1]QDX41213.1 acyl-CoA thioesterase [Salarchaeum sp. JOR-1]